MKTHYAELDSVTLVGVFESREEAEQAVSHLREAGFRDDQIGLLTGQADRKWHRSRDSRRTHWEDGLGLGAAAGTATGTIMGLAVIAGVLPPLGPIIAGGAVAALLASAGVGAAAGSAVGALIGLGISEHEATQFEADLRAGRVLVTVHYADDRIQQAQTILRDAGGATRTMGDPG